MLSFRLPVLRSNLFFHIYYVILLPPLWHGGLLCRLACSRSVRNPEFFPSGFVRCRDNGNCFVKIGVKRFFFGLNHLHAVLSQYRHEFIINQFHSFFHGCYVCGSFHVFQGAFEVVYNRKNAADGFSAPFRISSAFSFMVRLR